jgi:hypothetical protein
VILRESMSFDRLNTRNIGLGLSASHLQYVVIDRPRRKGNTRDPCSLIDDDLDLQSLRRNARFGTAEGSLDWR